MLTRFLGGAVACAGAAGALSAQSPIVIPQPPAASAASTLVDVGSPLSTAPSRLPAVRPAPQSAYPGTAIAAQG
ncbi:MAG: hypothetical protein KF873_23475, partial [Gemmataceae bacterium]|nr:hypothetical protein [Gemmataceae bacterium]